MKYRRFYNNRILTLSILVISFFCVIITLNRPSQDISFSTNDFNKDLVQPRISYTPISLNNSNIEVNDSFVFRLFESVNITINTSGFNDVEYVTLQTVFSNGTVSYYNMSKHPIHINNYSYIFKPSYNAPLGKQNISFLIYNVSNTLLNTHTTYTDFQIVSNYMANFDSTRYFIGDTLSANFVIYNFSDYEFNWDLTVVDSVKESEQNNLTNLGENLYQSSFIIDNETFSQVNKLYYIKANFTNSTGEKKWAAYFPFEISNKRPQIISSSVNFSLTEIFRTENCTITLNATDNESNSDDLKIEMIITDSEGAKLPKIQIPHITNNIFKESFWIESFRPKGIYRFNITATDPDGGVDWYSDTLKIKNNPPEIHSYRINKMSMNESISILYGRDLVFTFNVSDVEGISYIEVKLINERDEWFNITSEYKGQDTKITIRTVDLLTGTWFVYIYVIDTDGIITSLTDDYNLAPQGIRIIPDVLSTYIPWITFFSGLVIGILAAIGIAYKAFKSKFKKLQNVTPKRTQIADKKGKADKEIESKVSKDKEEQKEEEDLEVKKETDVKIAHKRKIKRKL